MTNMQEWRPRQEPDNRQESVKNQHVGWGTVGGYGRLENNELRPELGHVSSDLTNEKPGALGGATGLNDIRLKLPEYYAIAETLAMAFPILSQHWGALA